MIRISTGIRNLNARAAVNCLLAKHLPRSSSSSSSSADYTSSAIALRERSDNSSFTDRHRNPVVDVSAGGGPRPRAPRQWKTKTKRGSIAKSEKLLDVVNRLPNTKEEVYGALDAWIAWDLAFPLIPVKKAMKTLKDAEEWRRIIQVSKWMLDKGQGRTLNTYQLLLQAFDHEGRIEEAEALWEKVRNVNLESIPRAMFAQVISMYDRHGKYMELLKVFADMEELQVKADPGTLGRVVRAYTRFGYQGLAQTLLEKYPQSDLEFRYIKGKRVKVRSRPEEGKTDTVPVEQRLGLQKETLRLETSNNLDGTTPEISNELKEMPRFGTSNKLEGTTPEISNDMEERVTLNTSNEAEEGPASEISKELKEMLRLETSNKLEETTPEISNELKEMLRLETSNKLEGTTPEISNKLKEMRRLDTGNKLEGTTREISNHLEEELTLKTSNELQERRTLETVTN